MATYWVRNLGGTNKAAAVDEAHGMNVATFNASTFSENDRIFFSNIDGNITSSIILPSGGITISSGPNQQTVTIVHGADTLDACIKNSGKSGVIIEGIDVTHPAQSGTNTTGDAIDCIIRNVDSGYSGNQAFQNEVGSPIVIYEDVVGHHCVDDGFSAHDNANCTIYRGNFYSNKDGIAGVGTSKIICYDCNVYENIGITSSSYNTSLFCEGSGANFPELTFIRGSVTAPVGFAGGFIMSINSKIKIIRANLQHALNCTRLFAAINNGEFELESNFINGNGCTQRMIAQNSGTTWKINNNVLTGIAPNAYVMVNEIGSVSSFSRNIVIHDPRYSTGPGKGVFAKTDLDCINNIFIGLVTGIERTGGTVNSKNNCFFGCTTNKAGTITSSGDITDDPLLNADYTLQATSPCIGNGIAIEGIITDRAGDPTPGPHGTSIGPHEYMSHIDPGYGMRALFDGTIPAWALPAGVQFARFNKIVGAFTIARTLPL